MRKIILLLLFISLFVIAPASADEYVGYHTLTPPTDIPVFDPFETVPFNTWTNENGDLDTWAMLVSLTVPYTMLFGQWIFLILYALFLYSVYARSRGVELVVISIGLTASMWATLVPQESLIIIVLIFILGISAILFRTYKRR